MSYAKKNSGTILACLVEVLVGVVLFINPIRFTSAILVGVGVVLLVCGVVCLVRYFRTEAAQAALEQNFFKGLLLLLLGALLTFWTQWVLALFPLVTHLYGVAILIVGLFKLQQAVNLLRLKLGYWFLMGLNAIVAILFAVIILNNPFTSTIVLWRLAAISLIVEAFLDAAVLIFVGRNRKTYDTL